MDYHLLLARARDQFNLVRSKFRLIDSPEFKEFWDKITPQERDKLATASAFALKKRFTEHKEALEGQPCAKLRARCAELGIKYYSFLSKQQMIEAIKKKETELCQTNSSTKG